MLFIADMLRYSIVKHRCTNIAESSFYSLSFCEP